MKAVLVEQPGGPEQMVIGDYPTPEPQADEILVKVKATAVNRADVLQRKGYYPPPQGASPILGLEIAGVVEKVGSAVTKWKPGDRVFGLLEGGGYAEYAVIAEDMALPIPENLSFAEAAAIPEVFLTAYQTLFWIGDLKRGERVLIHAGASGVGTAAIQLAKAAGAEVVVTAGSEGKLEACRKLGADLAINYKEGPFVDKIEDVYGEAAMDVILDFIGAPYFEANLRALAYDGRWVLISTLGGARLEAVDLSAFMAKRIAFTATTLRSRSKPYKIRLTKEFAEQTLPRFRSGELKPVIDRRFPIEQVQDAHRYMEENRNIGKIVLTIGE